MNPIPPIVDGRGLPFDTDAFQPLALAVLVGAFLIYAFVLWAARRGARERVLCPVWHRMARVLFNIAPDGSRTDVIACSLLDGRTMEECGKRCLRTRSPAPVPSHG